MRPRAVFFDDEARDRGIGPAVARRAGSLGVTVGSHQPDGQRPGKGDLVIRMKRGKWLKPFLDACSCGPAEYFLTAVTGCPHSCAYCFVPGYTGEECTTLHANVEDMVAELSEFLGHETSAGARVHAAHLGELVEWEEWTGFTSSLVALFASAPKSVLEVRTKTSAMIADVWSAAPANVVFSWSLSPASSVGRFEPGLPGPAKRLEALSAAAGCGATVALRLDPVILSEDMGREYARLASLAGAKLGGVELESVEIGAFRCSARAAEHIRKGPGKTIMAAEVTRTGDGKYRYAWQARVKAYRTIAGELRRAFGSDLKLRFSTEPDWIVERVTG